MTSLLLVIAGGIGAAMRFLVDRAVVNHLNARIPCGTIVVNLTGSFLMGLVAGAFWWCGLSSMWRQVIGTGLLGGYTTFSTACVETMQLMTQRCYARAFLHAFGMLLLSLIGVGLGLMLMRHLA